MLLLTGPPASGKTVFCVRQFRECLRRRDRDCLLLVPTTTAAEHLRNELAREGLLLSPKSVTTFGRFIGELTPGLPPASTAAIELIVSEELERLNLTRYGAVRDFPGFQSALVRALEEFTGAGGQPEHLALTGGDFAAVHEAVQSALKARGLYVRSARLAHAAAKIREVGCPASVFVAGFFGFTAPETWVLRALAERSRLVVAVPEHSSLTALREFAREERRLAAPAPAAGRTLFTAATPDAEASEIARRILAERASGRPFREMGVIARSELPAVPALRAAFERFGIPARFYFAPALSSDPTVRFLLAVVDAALSGWDYELTLEALRSSGSPLEVYGDKWEHDVRNALPGAGLAGMRALATEWSRGVFDDLEPLSEWSAQTLPSAAWARQFGALSALVRPPKVHDRARPETVERWRQQAAALQHFHAAVAETANSLDAAAAISCSAFLNALRSVLRSASVRLVDHRRDVVHVIDAVEARQWRLPVVFVCGLLESQFPKHHSEDPILSDSVRRRLQSAGVSVKTSIDRQEDEQALFDAVLTRATEHLYLSYAQLNAKGEPNLPSFYLERAKPWATGVSIPVRPAPAYARAAEPSPSIYSEELRARLASKYSVISPSHVETYLQCPYQAFARYTLKLKPAPGDPWERFDRLTQGSIAHKVFERHYRDGIPVRDAFTETFDVYAREKRLPEGYRTEAIRLELLNGIEMLAADSRLLCTAPTSLFEHKFTVDLGEGTTARGQIDRLDIDEMNNAVVFDYKYRRRTGIRESINDNKDGTKVQGGLYLLGARSLGYTPAGMVYCGFRREVSVGGWVVAPLYPHLGSSCSRDQLLDVMQTAQQVAIRVAAEIRDGRIVPAPEDTGKCGWCEFASICRIETVRAAQTRTADVA